MDIPDVQLVIVYGAPEGTSQLHQVYHFDVVRLHGFLNDHIFFTAVSFVGEVEGHHEHTSSTTQSRRRWTKK